MKRTPLILQAEESECGLACLVMIATHHGHKLGLKELRNQYAPSSRGMRLSELIEIANGLQFATRPVRLDLESLHLLALPAILHWDLNHFVVLEKVDGSRFNILDPSKGRVTQKMEEVSKHFTGVALELQPQPNFAPRLDKKEVSFRQLLGRLPAKMPRHIAIVLVLSLLLEMAVTVAPLYVQFVIDQAVAQSDQQLALKLGLVFLLILCLQVAWSASRSWLMAYLSIQINLQLSGNLFQHLVRLPLSYFERRQLGDVTSRFESLNVIQRTLINGFFMSALDGIMVLVTVSMMMLYSLKLSLIAIIAGLCYVAMRAYLYESQYIATQEQIERATKQQSHLLESIRGLQTIKLFCREDSRSRVWTNLSTAMANATLRTQRLTIAYQSSSTFLFGLENILVIAIGAHFILSGDMSIGMLFAFVTFKLQFVTRLGSLVDRLFEYKMLSLHKERVGDIVATEKEVDKALSKTDELPEEICVELLNVGFRYATTEPWILRGVNLRINPGEFVAISGPSGCGKTTLLKILLGLLKPTEGVVKVNGMPLDDIGMKTWRDALGSVMQDDCLFTGSIADNITFFSEHLDAEHLVHVAKQAGIHSDIQAMPMKYETLIGEMGNLLSGGQRQRILLARALYRRPKILCLDEATSHLDLQLEQQVNREVSALSLTRVIIAHRKETLEMAGRVVEFPFNYAA